MATTNSNVVSPTATAITIAVADIFCCVDVAHTAGHTMPMNGPNWVMKWNIYELTFCQIWLNFISFSVRISMASNAFLYSVCFVTIAKKTSNNYELGLNAGGTALLSMIRFGLIKCGLWCGNISNPKARHLNKAKVDTFFLLASKLPATHTTGKPQKLWPFIIL